MGWLSDIVGEDTANFLETGDRDKGGDELFGGDSGGEAAALLIGLGLAPFTGGASLGAASAYLGYLGQKDINKANAEQALAQMSFQERMSSTAHQREVQDLRLAGLNPILSANGGSSSPSGAMAVLQNPARELSSNIGQIYSNAQSAAATKLTNATIATQRTQQALNVAQSQNIQAETINKLQQNKLKTPAQTIARWKQNVFDTLENSAKGLKSALDGSWLDDFAASSGRASARKKVRVLPR